MKINLTKVFTIVAILLCCVVHFIILHKLKPLKDKLIYNLDLDICLDSGLCKEGLPLNTEYGLITINEETCKKYNWEWRDAWNDCHIK